MYFALQPFLVFKALNPKRLMKSFLSAPVAALLLGASAVFAQENLTKPEQTEVWEPQPRIVTPADAHKAPSDAIVLFDGTSLDKFKGKDGNAPKWKLENGTVTVVGGTGDIWTRDRFGDCQLHIEWRSPMEPETLSGQGKGNSGVFFQDRYEVQVLNSYQSKTYANGQAASIYKQHSPLVNAMRPMGEWQTYDIIYTAPRFRANGSLETPAYVTVIHNGIVVQNHAEIQGTTEYIGAPIYKAHGEGPIRLQDHGNPVSYRNIWIRPLK